MTQIKKGELIYLLENFCHEELDRICKKIYLLGRLIILTVSIPTCCVLCSKITKNVWIDDFKVINNSRVDREIAFHFYCSNCGFRRKRNDSLESLEHSLENCEKIKSDYIKKGI